MMPNGEIAGMKLVRRNDRGEVRHRLDLACQIVRERDFRVIADRAVDVSPNGMLVVTDHDLEAGENLFVTFKATQLGLWFDTEASVERFVLGRRAADRAPGVGIRFTTLDPVKRLILRGHLRRVPPPLPSRSQRIDWTATIRRLHA